MSYNWSAYYRSAYEREKRKNTILAGQVADAEAKREELQNKYIRICNNPLYKMLRPFSLLKRGCLKMKRKAEEWLHGNGTSKNGGGSAVSKMSPGQLQASYRERLAWQADGYGQWIREKESVLWREWQAEKEGKESYPESCQVIPYACISKIKNIADAINKTNANDTKTANISEKSIRKPDILLFAENPEELDKRAVSYITDWFAAYPATKLLYGNEDRTEGERRSFPWMKPCFSPDTLLGFFYLGSYFAVDRAWAEKTPLSGYKDAGENLYRYVLELLKPYFDKNRHESTKEIACCDMVLYHRTVSGSSEILPDREYFLHTGEMIFGEHPEFWGFEEKYIPLKQDFIKELGYDSVAYQTAEPKVWTVVSGITAEDQGQAGTLAEPEEVWPLLSVIIPSKDQPELLKKCIGTFLERTVFPADNDCSRGNRGIEFIIVDNGSSKEKKAVIEAFLNSLSVECHYLYHPMEFNFSVMCNLGAKSAKGKYLLLLNDDMEIVEENWLRILLGQALLPGTGAVGAKLWYPEGERIQHAGITNMHIGPSHKLVTFPDDRVYYYGHNTLPYDMIAVTAACLLVKKSIYQEVGGLDEEMAVSYNDVDFCFKVAEAGYRNVVRNDAVLQHHESASRGLDEISEEKWIRLLNEKSKLYKKHPLFNKTDPYYSENLVDNAPDYRIGYQYPYERLLLTASPEKRMGKDFLQKASSGLVMLTVERAGQQRKIHLEEPDIYEIEGWCYMLHQDNSLFERFLVLESRTEDFYYLIPVRERRRPDVEAILPQQKNIGLSGFTCRILKEDLTAGGYIVGMLYRNLTDGAVYYQCSGKVMDRL